MEISLLQKMNRLILGLSLMGEACSTTTGNVRETVRHQKVRKHQQSSLKIAPSTSTSSKTVPSNIFASTATPSSVKNFIAASQQLSTTQDKPKSLLHRLTSLFSVESSVQDDDDDSSETRVDSHVCSCNHCKVANRIPSEIVDDVNLKCAPHSEKDAETECYDSTEPMNFLRYCFEECLPPQGLTSPVGAMCEKLTQKETHALEINESEKEVDPAGLMSLEKARDVQKLQQDKKRLKDEQKKQQEVSLVKKSSKQDPAASVESARTTAQTGDQLNKDVVAEAERTADDAAGKMESGDSEEGVSSFRESIHKAAEASRQAEQAAEEAVKVADGGCDIIWNAAVEAGQQGIQNVADEAAANAATATAYLTKQADTPVARAEAAAEKAAEPFSREMVRAQATARDYVANAEAKAAEAEKFETEARQYEKTAKQLFHQGKEAKDTATINQARASIAEAQRLWEEGQRSAEKSNEYRSQAEKINELIPKYSQSATSAALIAAYKENPAMYPPPA